MSFISDFFSLRDASRRQWKQIGRVKTMGLKSEGCVSWGE
jgi:hypothetical protein